MGWLEVSILSVHGNCQERQQDLLDPVHNMILAGFLRTFAWHFEQELEETHLDVSRHLLLVVGLVGLYLLM